MPIDKPITTLIIRLISATFEETAASDCVLVSENCPMTIKSAALNSNCNMPEKASGNDTAMSFLSSGPLVISMSLSAAAP